jgi:TRAP-type C4-dicarboxylate transport system permease large subunit
MPIPLFLLMGEVFFHTGLGQRMFSRSTNFLAACRAG